MSFTEFASRVLTFPQALTREKLGKEENNTLTLEETVFYANSGGRVGKVGFIGDNSAILDERQLKLLKDYENGTGITPCEVEKRPDGRYLVRLPKQTEKE